MSLIRDEEGLRMETDAEYDNRLTVGDDRIEEFQAESEMDRQLRDSMQERMDREQSLSDMLKRALKEELRDRPALLALIESYAEAKARFIIARDSMERCGFLRK